MYNSFYQQQKILFFFFEGNKESIFIWTPANFVSIEKFKVDMWQAHIVCILFECQ